MFDIRIQLGRNVYHYLVRATTLAEATQIAEGASGGKALTSFVSEQWVTETIYPEGWQQATETGIALLFCGTLADEYRVNFGWSL